MTLFEKSSGALSREDIPAVSQAVFDIASAGDTSISVFALCLAAGATRNRAAQIANLAAGIVAGRRCTAHVTVEDLWVRIVRTDKEISLGAHAGAA